VAPILVGCVVGFLAGEIFASVLILVAAVLSHFPGGYAAISTATVPPWWSVALGLVGLWAGFASAVYLATVHGHLKPLRNQWRPRLGDLWCVPFGVGCQFVIDLLYAPFHFKKMNAPVNHIFGAAHGAAFALLVVLTVFVAPVFEEWFFRGVLYRTLDEGCKGFAPALRTSCAVALSAILFALAHGEALQFVGLALFGVVLALVLRRTQRLVPSVITHMSFNAVAAVVLINQRLGH
jgi:membrane protease YdiL (CAAX protease family)